jgi:hypothetical protein
LGDVGFDIQDGAFGDKNIDKDGVLGRRGVVDERDVGDYALEAFDVEGVLVSLRASNVS